MNPKSKTIEALKKQVSKTHIAHFVEFPVELGNATLEAYALIIAPFGTTEQDILEHPSYVYRLQSSTEE